MAKKLKNPKPAPSLRIPSPAADIRDWLIFGLDPSLSRTGYSLLLVSRRDDDVEHRWLDVGSLKPDDTKAPVWVRSKAIALMLRDTLNHHAFPLLQAKPGRLGLIISFEAPTPRNDFLTSISRILHLVLFDDTSSAHDFAGIFVQTTNAATLRSLMGLTQRGAGNKKENIEKAYSYVHQESYPALDTDSCDAVLMATMARWAATILLGLPFHVPQPFLTALVSGAEEVVGKGTRQHTRIKGLLHRAEYWSPYTRKPYGVLLRDARVKKTRPQHFLFTI